MSSNQQFQSRHAGAFDLSGSRSESDPLEDILARLCFEHGYNVVRGTLRRLAAANGVEEAETSPQSAGRARWKTRIRKEIEQAAKDGIDIDEREASRRISARMRQGASGPSGPEPETAVAA